ncbi:hypothetical protein BDU57DRAFT_541452 [Ampelomyces quisqualis]|uniref:Asl1-like glycosyl hydrolase catalytic domain-containing protein n=1 Tax=Ampelomyces quisqualis TaxID=50730 RepID=A0A6A5QGZ1_AMPQU|nr:hypothetical protein BDU57DRAFT_541452 [Ampelomyces quisqualis]
MQFLHLLIVVGLALLVSAGSVTIRQKSSPPEKAGTGRRRGIAYNDPKFVHLFNVENNQMGWCYNWYPTSDETSTPFEYVPMLWGNHDDVTRKWASAVQQAANAQINSPTHLLSFNEPDICEPGAGGSCMSVPSAVAAWNQWMQPAKSIKEKMYLGSPAVSNGAHGRGLDWLRDFITACTSCSVDFICIHWYDAATNVEHFKRHVDAARTVAAGRPIWITELGPRGTDEEIKTFLDQVIPWLEASGDVHRYAFFMAREGFLVNAQGNGLSEVGAYVTYWRSDGQRGFTVEPE